MLRSVGHIFGYRIQASDGELGTVKDLYFDDHAWVVRYFVVDTDKWLTGRQVLISPSVVGLPDWANEELPVSLTKQQVELSPSTELDHPISRQHEHALARYYGWMMWWEPVAMPVGMPMGIPYPPPEIQEQAPSGDPNLRSARDILNYSIHATDGRIGHVDDFVAETDGWAVRYLVVDTRNWLPGRKVLLSPDWVLSITSESRQVDVDLTMEQVRNSPAFDPYAPVNREYEARLYDYYGRPRYWREGPPLPSKKVV